MLDTLGMSDAALANHVSIQYVPVLLVQSELTFGYCVGTAWGSLLR
jgi:hypothetical protein